MNVFLNSIYPNVIVSTCCKYFKLITRRLLLSFFHSKPSNPVYSAHIARLNSHQPGCRWPLAALGQPRLTIKVKVKRGSGSPAHAPLGACRRLGDVGMGSLLSCPSPHTVTPSLPQSQASSPGDRSKAGYCPCSRDAGSERVERPHVQALDAEFLTTWTGRLFPDFLWPHQWPPPASLPGDIWAFPLSDQQPPFGGPALPY